MHVTAKCFEQTPLLWKNIEQKLSSSFKRILYFFLENKFEQFLSP